MPKKPECFKCFQRTLTPFTILTEGDRTVEMTLLPCDKRTTQSTGSAYTTPSMYQEPNQYQELTMQDKGTY